MFFLLLLASEEFKFDYIVRTIEPTPQLLEFWTDTFPARRYELVENSLPIDLYFKKYKCLQMNFGHDLVI